MAGGGCNIRTISECFIKPNQIVEDSKKAFHLGSSELMQMSQCHLQIGLLFPNKLPTDDDGTTSSMESFLDSLKESLSSTLVHFYPLAGQFVTEVDEEKHKSVIFIDCNKGPGAKFIHAALDDVTVNDITSPAHVPTTLVQSLFQLGTIPTNYDGHTEPLLVVQVTELVDGLFFGVSMNHSVVDGSSFWHVFSSWSEMFRSKSAAVLSTPPVYNRWFPEGYGPSIQIPHARPEELMTRYKMHGNEPPLTDVILHFSRKSVEMLKAKANEECGGASKISSFQAVSALIWRSIIRSNGDVENSTSTCMFVANARARVTPPQPQNYFGSLIAPSWNTSKVSELLDKSLGSVALILNKSVENMNDEYVREQFIRWTNSPVFFPTPGPDLRLVLISGSHREDAYGIDFGLGKAVALRTASNKYGGKVVFRPAREGKGSVDVEVCLSPDTMAAFQQDAELLSFLN
ncbi:hypothetical protein V2J09_010428 [Rumex salicifolius]